MALDFKTLFTQMFTQLFRLGGCGKMSDKKKKESIGPGIEEKKNKAGETVSYKFRCCVARDEQYKQIWRTCTISKDDPRLEGLTPKKLKDELNSIKHEWDKQQKADYEKNHSKTDKARITFKEFVTDHWMKDHVIPGHTPSSIQFFQYTSDKAIQYFGDKKKLKDIDTESVKRYLNYLRETPTDTGERFAPVSIKHFYGTLRNILKYAKRLKYIDSDPTEDLAPNEKPHREKKDVDFLKPEEAARFLKCLEAETLYWQCLINVMLITGLRRGEAIALQWQDINSKNLELSVVRNVTLDKNSETGLNVGKTKTGECRTVPISARLEKMLSNLKEEREIQLSPKDENGNIITRVTLHGTSYIFCSSDPYRPIRPDSVTTKVKRFVTKNNLQNLSPHDLRHSAATLAILSGASLKAVQALLGHKYAETTMQAYLGVTKEAKRECVDGTEGLLFQKAENQK